MLENFLFEHAEHRGDAPFMEEEEQKIQQLVLYYESKTAQYILYNDSISLTASVFVKN